MGVVLLIDQVAAEDLDSTDEEIDTRLPGLDTVSSCMRIVDSTVPSQSGNWDGPGLSRSICAVTSFKLAHATVRADGSNM